MAGDPDSARHLGYYAELRAAMSILAGDGIGVFLNKHIVVTKEQECVFLDYGTTHRFAWEALKAWASSSAGLKILFRVIKPGGILLQDWLDQFSAGSGFIASEWLQRWGLDLSRLTKDRDARNLASYRPTAFTSPGPRPIGDTMEAILRFWEICEPGAVGGFPILDRHLLRRSLALISEENPKNIYDERLSMMLNALDPKELSSNQWAEFLKYEKLQDIHQIIQYANAQDDSYHMGFVA